MLSRCVAATASPAVLTPAQRQQIDDNLILAKDYMRDVKVDLKPEDLAYVLSEGANNVNQILESILTLDAGNRPALHMKTQITDLYLRKARELQRQRQPAAALRLVRYGLKVTCDNLDLNHMRRDICEQDPALCLTN
jgi:hypothetical protein